MEGWQNQKQKRLCLFLQHMVKFLKGERIACSLVYGWAEIFDSVNTGPEVCDMWDGTWPNDWKLACALGSLCQTLAADRTFRDRSSKHDRVACDAALSLCLWGKKQLKPSPTIFVPKSRSSPWRWQDVFQATFPSSCPWLHLHTEGFLYLHISSLRVVLYCSRHEQLPHDLWTVACQTSLAMGFPESTHWRAAPSSKWIFQPVNQTVSCRLHILPAVTRKLKHRFINRKCPDSEQQENSLQNDQSQWNPSSGTMEKRQHTLGFQ